MDPEKIARINALSRKQRGEGLTEEEVEEQRTLRLEYVAAVRRNMQAQLDVLTGRDPETHEPPEAAERDAGASPEG